MKQKEINKLVLGVCFSLCMGGAYASVPSGGESSVGKLMQIGEKSNEDLPELRGFATDLPLISVLKQITPSGWMVKKSVSENNNIDVNMPVSWTGGKNWVNTLEHISKNYGVNFLVNWDKKTILVSKVEQVGEKKSDESKKVVESTQVTEVFQVEESMDKKVENNESNAETPKVQEPEKWTTKSDKTLKENVEEWSKKAGYDLVWTGKNYRIAKSEIFFGDFDSDTGPIKQLSEDYGPDSRVEVPLSFMFYGNKVLEVKNWEFEQSGK